jgi:hypothetical protein
MLRRAIAALILIALAGCAAQEQRPEGIVQRWLVALNQGSAGEPGRYALESLSGTILPDWRRSEPGHFDVIDVQPAAIRSCSVAFAGDSCEPQGRMASVPFNLEDTDGALFSFEVTLVEQEGTWTAVALEPNDNPMSLGKQRWPSTLDRSSWLLAGLTALCVTALTAALMMLVRRGGTPVISSPASGVGSERGGDRA